MSEHTAENDVPPCFRCGHRRQMHGLRNDRCVSAYPEGSRRGLCDCTGYVIPPSSGGAQ